VPARLLLLDDASATPTERWVERPFLTIGTDSGSDVLLATGGQEVRVYLQFREGRYEAFNKQAGEVRLGGRPVPAGTSAAWESGVELEAGGHRLRLVVEGDPAPGPRPLAAPSRPVREPIREQSRSSQATTPAPAAMPDAAPPPDRSRTIKLGVIFACLAASTLLVLRDRILPASTVAASDPEAVTALIEDAFKAEATAAKQPAAELRQRLVRRLQSAETAWLEGDEVVAAERYAALKRYLDGSRLAAKAKTSPADPGPAGAKPVAADWQARLAGHVDARLADPAGQ
jgi:hypothetical protein